MTKDNRKIENLKRKLQEAEERLKMAEVELIQYRGERDLVLQSNSIEGQSY